MIVILDQTRAQDPVARHRGGAATAVVAAGVDVVKKAGADASVEVDVRVARTPRPSSPRETEHTVLPVPWIAHDGVPVVTDEDGCQ